MKPTVISSLGVVLTTACVFVCLFVCLLTLQQAFNATAVIRHMRRLQLGTSTEGPNPNLLLPDEDAGACLLCVSRNRFPACAE